MKPFRIVAAVLIAAVLAHESRMAGSQEQGPRRLKTRHILLVTTDGLRWQEVFGGAAASLLNREQGGVHDVDAPKQAFGRDTPEHRREALMPFFWGTSQTIKGSERIRIAVLGPDTPARGDQDSRQLARLTQGQVAATLAAFLGRDYRAFAPRAAPPIARVLPEAVQVHSSVSP